MRATNMAPISPDSLKRGSAGQSSDDERNGPQRKKQRIETLEERAESPAPEPVLPATPPPEAAYTPLPIHHGTLFNDDPEALLRRSIALALKHVGFDGARPEALAAIVSEVDAYAAKFLAGITLYILNSRRERPTPLDFYYGLQDFDIPIDSLKPHLKLPIPKENTLIQLEPSPLELFGLPYKGHKEERRKAEEIRILLGPELDGRPEKEKRKYIPEKFIPFPSRHTFQATPRDDTRETDTRKIREMAAKEARAGEEALRKFMSKGKSSKANDLKKAASKDPLSNTRHEKFEKLRASFAALSPNRKPGTDGEDEDHTVIVNSEAKYFRKGVTVRKVILPVLHQFSDGAPQTNGILPGN
ncbi:hypothetical protein BJ878DRAFT_247085 [Calycina marina]|uniref:Transcription initiation factor TFIID subunit 8 n=1 Tax=Calycina marina TaxID=1763456 RepID=A0A9P7Z7N3_9HELO|nr:hypothetical protein BJ878DRAFT_247085 [Calycina marina]